MFDLSEVESVTNEVIPVGKYICTVSDAIVKDTKDRTGEYIAVSLRVAHGGYAGRVIFHNFHIKNTNPKATGIGLGQLKTMLEKMGMGLTFETPFDCCEAIFGKSVGVRTKIRRDETYGDKAEVSSFFPVTETAEEEEEVSF
jgi:hypothetical protein